MPWVRNNHFLTEPLILAPLFPTQSLEEHLLRTISTTNTGKWLEAKSLITSESLACRSFSDIDSAKSPVVFPTAFLNHRLARCNYDCDFSFAVAWSCLEEDTVPWGGKRSLTAHWSLVCCSSARRLWLNFFLEARSTPSLHSCTSGSFCYRIWGLWGITATFTILASVF